ncbi:MAG: DNA polymerase III subunit delta, partial [Bacteroidetes bacterium]
MAKSKVEGISFAELERKHKQRQFASVYLFFGEEEFLFAEGLDSLIEHAVDPSTSSFNLDVFYGSEIDARKIIEAASSYPMMAERRVVIVKEFDKVSNKELLVSYLEKPFSSTSL